MLKRDPISCRVEEILDVVAESGAAIEINGDPHRIDLEPRWIIEARKRPIKFVISTDAHSTCLAPDATRIRTTRVANLTSAVTPSG